MKRAVLVAVCFLFLLLFCGCQKEEQDAAETEKPETIAVTFVNGVEEANVWILPMTEENLKTTLWGTATAKTKEGERCRVPLCDPGDDGLYIPHLHDLLLPFALVGDDVGIGDREAELLVPL